jgi:hypothetical protein
MSKKRNDIDVPPMANTNPNSIEVLRVWVAPGAPQQLTLRTFWKDPRSWGLLLADIARHAAKAYEREGGNRDDILRKIEEAFRAEWAYPTDDPEDLTDIA